MNLQKTNFHIYLILFVALFVLLSPVVYMTLIALTPHKLLFHSLLPHVLTIENFLKVLSNTEMVLSYRNSWIIASSTASIVLIMASLAAYGFSRFRFRRKKLIILILLLTQMLPMELLAVSYFKIITQLNLYNTKIALIIADSTFTLPFCILILTSVFDSIPLEIEDAAMIDGASRMSCFIRIVLPLSSAGLCAAWLFCFIQSWAEYLYALVFTSDYRAMPITVEISKLVGHYITSWEVMMALALLTALPIVILFIIFQKTFIKGLTGGAIKG